MSESKITAGDIVVCINKTGWFTVEKKRTMTGPEYGESLTVEVVEVGKIKKDRNYLRFKEYSYDLYGSYDETLFIKVINPPNLKKNDKDDKETKNDSETPKSSEGERTKSN